MCSLRYLGKNDVAERVNMWIEKCSDRTLSKQNFRLELLIIIFPWVTLFFICGCVSREPVQPSPLPSDLQQVIDQRDLQPIYDEAQRILIELIQAKSINPPGDEDKVNHIITKHLKAVGVTPSVQYFAPHRSNLYATLSPSVDDLSDQHKSVRSHIPSGPICLLSHSDVVPADPKSWSVNPFEGVVKDGSIWGRGSLDMKGVTALHLTVFKWLARQLNRGTLELKRGVALIVVGDEEVDNLGMRSLIEQRWQDLQCAYVLNEGSFGIKDLIFKGQDVMPISVGEKGVLWVKLSVKTKSGHGSVPRKDFAPHILLTALEKIRTYQSPVQISQALTELFHIIGEDMGGLSGLILKRPLLTSWFALDQFLAVPEAAAGLTNTFHVTSFSADTHKPNVVPARASALIDIRILAGTQPKTTLLTLEKIIDDDRVRIEVMNAMASEVSPWRHDPFYLSLLRHSQRVFPDVLVGPATSVGFTDSSYARRMGARAYGWVPFLLTQDNLATMHGDDERLPIQQLQHGIDALSGVILEVATVPSH